MSTPAMPDGPAATGGTVPTSGTVPASGTVPTSDTATAGPGGVHPRSEVAPVAAPARTAPAKSVPPTAVPTKPAPAEPAPAKPGPAEIAQAMVEDALRLPDAVEDTATFVPRPGSPAAEPAVQAAKAEAEAARAAFAAELAMLKTSGAAAVDIKARVRDLPSAVAADPRKALGIGAAGAGAVALARGFRRGRRKPAVPGLLPPEVEAALGDAGGDTEKVRDALRAGFTSYLEAHGAEVAKPRRRVKGVIPLLVLPVASTVAREAIKRSFRRAAKD